MDKRQIKVFLISFALQFLMTSLIYLGIKPPAINALVTPVIEVADLLEPYKEKLSKKENFILKESLLTPASGDYTMASAYSVIDYDSGEILASKNFSMQLPIASLTKLMTAVVALDLASPSDTFSVSEAATKAVPSKVMLKDGERVSLEKLLNATLIASANDAAFAIRDGIDKKENREIFTKAMNYKAAQLGLKNTSFTNPAGFDSPKNFSSVEDLSLLTHYALENYPLIKEIVAKPFADLNSGLDTRFYLNNWNGLLGVYPGVFGVKIGNTAEAGQTTVVISEREGKKLMVVVLGAPGVLERDLWAAQLLDEGFSKMGLPKINVSEDDLKVKYASWRY